MTIVLSTEEDRRLLEESTSVSSSLLAYESQESFKLESYFAISIKMCEVRRG